MLLILLQTIQHPKQHNCASATKRYIIKYSTMAANNHVYKQFTLQLTAKNSIFDIFLAPENRCEWMFDCE